MSLDSTAKLSALSRTTDVFARFLNDQETHDFKHAHCLSFLKRVISSCVTDELSDDDIPVNLEIHLKCFQRDLPDIHFLMQAFIAHYRRVKFNVTINDNLLDGYCYDALKALSRRIENFSLSKSSTPSEALLWLDRYTSQYLTSYFRTWWGVLDSLMKETANDVPDGECYAIELDRFGRSLKMAMVNNIAMLGIIINSAHIIDLPGKRSMSNKRITIGAFNGSDTTTFHHTWSPTHTDDDHLDSRRFDIIQNTLTEKFYQSESIGILFLCYSISNDYERNQINPSVYRPMADTIVSTRLLNPLINYHADFGADFLKYVDSYAMDMKSNLSHSTIMDCFIKRCNDWLESAKHRDIEVSVYQNISKTINYMKLKQKI